MITQVAGIRVGHWTDGDARTGCTVVLCPPGTVGSGEVRGGAPGTRETDLLGPGMLVEHVNAILLSGGSAFGLAAADGVMRWLEERGEGFETPVARVPIVPAAVLFDLGVGNASIRPGPQEGYAACDAAGTEIEEGRVGAGTGATVAKLYGPERALPGGLGTASRIEDGVTVGALAVVNAFGEILDQDGEILVGAAAGEGEEVIPPFPGGVAPTPSPERPAEPTAPPDEPHQPTLGPMNTTLAVVATDAALSRERAHLLAIAAHDALASAIRPSHTMWDGDTVFTLATGTTEVAQPALERMAEEALTEAIRRAVTAEGGTQ